MFYEKPMPFYMAYPVPYLFDQEKEQDRDLQVMKSFYSEKAMKIQELVEQECDRMEYDGSMMFDDYPDKWMMRQLCRKIEEKLPEDGSEMEAMHRREGLQDLIEYCYIMKCTVGDAVGEDAGDFFEFLVADFT